MILVMFPFRERGNLNEAVVISTWDVSTQLWLGRKFDVDSTQETQSKLDETYKQKYDRRLLDLRTLSKTMVKAIFCAGTSELKSVEINEEINKTSTNIDFIVILRADILNKLNRLLILTMEITSIPMGNL